jgi:hypothetical protein
MSDIGYRISATKVFDVAPTRVNLPDGKAVKIGLTYIYGIGPSVAKNGLYNEL